MKRRWNSFLDRLLGERCPSCGERVFPADRRLHAETCHSPLHQPKETR